MIGIDKAILACLIFIAGGIWACAILLNRLVTVWTSLRITPIDQPTQQEPTQPE